MIIIFRLSDLKVSIVPIDVEGQSFFETVCQFTARVWLYDSKCQIAVFSEIKLTSKQFMQCARLQQTMIQCDIYIAVVNFDTLTLCINRTAVHMRWVDAILRPFQQYFSHIRTFRG